jgi:hypothetical protein
MEREKRQEFVERTKNLLTAAESQVTSEKSQRSTGGSKKVTIHVQCACEQTIIVCCRFSSREPNSIRKAKNSSMIQQISSRIRTKRIENERKSLVITMINVKENHRSRSSAQSLVCFEQRSCLLCRKRKALARSDSENDNRESVKRKKKSNRKKQTSRVAISDDDDDNNNNNNNSNDDVHDNKRTNSHSNKTRHDDDEDDDDDDDADVADRPANDDDDASQDAREQQVSDDEHDNHERDVEHKQKRKATSRKTVGQRV